MQARLRQLGKDSVIYGLGGMIAKGLSFLLLPLYTRFFPPADYGRIETLVVINSFLAAVLVMGMDSAQSFFFFQQKEHGKPAQARVVTAILQFRLAWGTVLLVFSMLAVPLLNWQLFGGQLTWEHFAAAFLGAFFMQLASQSAEVYRLLYRPWSYIAVTLGNTLATAAATVSLILFLDWGIKGYFIGLAFGSFASAALGWWSIRNYLDWSHWYSDWWKRLIRFGAPFVPVSLAVYVMETADRWFIIRYYGQDVLGIYAVADKFALVLAMLVTTFRQAWWPIALDAVHGQDGPPLLRMMSRFYVGLGMIGVIVLAVVSPWLVKIVTAPAYSSAYILVGILALQPLCYGFELIASIGIWKSEKTKWYPLGLGIAAVINIGLAFWLVPSFGPMGAAISTAVAYLVWNSITLTLSERFWSVGLPLRTIGVQMFIGIVSLTAITLVDPGHDFWQTFMIACVGAIAILAITVKPSYMGWAWRALRNRGIVRAGGEE